MWSSDRTTLRTIFFRAWESFKEQRPLNGVEALIAEAILAHPEYQPFFEAGATEEGLGADPEQGAPFLHLSLHIALAEQLTTDRPVGVVGEWVRLRAALKDDHRALHLMMECLEASLWQAQHGGTDPSDTSYLACLHALPKKPGRSHG